MLRNWMKSTLLIILYAALVVNMNALYAVDFNGPVTVPANTTVSTEISNLPALDLTKSLGEAFKDLQSLKFIISAPEGSNSKLKQQIGFENGENGLQWAVNVSFTPDKEGVYVLISSFNGEINVRRITVGNSTPDKPNVDKKVSRATFIYEKDDHIVPNPLVKAFDELNRKGVIANVVEQDAKDGNNSFPIQFKKARDTAIQAGLPCLVIEYSDNTAITTNNFSEAEIRKAVGL